MSGKQFIFPRSCACCGAYPLTQLSVSGTERNKLSRTQGWLWEIPYCVQCRNHVKTTDRILVAYISLIGLAGLIGTGMSLFGPDRVVGVWLAVSLGVTSTSTLGWVLRRTRRKCSPNCLGLTRSVLYLGSVGTVHSFDIKSKFYAVEFVRSNHLKIVNASPQVASILRNTKFSEYQVARRMIRRSK